MEISNIEPIAKYNAWHNYCGDTCEQLHKLLHLNKDTKNPHLVVRLKDFYYALHLLEDLRHMTTHVPCGNCEIDMSKNLVDFLRRSRNCDCIKCWLIDH
jgi:DNA transposition AAA+ family ATPase